MNQVISYIVEKQLLSGAVVNLPQIGIFQIERQSARLTPDAMGIESPWEVLSFYSRVSEEVELTRDSIYSHLESYMQQSIAGYNFESAKIGYQNWINEVYVDLSQPINIDGVCRLVHLNGSWELSDIDDGFASLLLEPDQEPLALNVECDIERLEREFHRDWETTDTINESENEAIYSSEISNSNDNELSAVVEFNHKDSATKTGVVLTEGYERGVSQSSAEATRGLQQKGARIGEEQRVPKSSPIGLVISILALLAAAGYLIYNYIN